MTETVVVDVLMLALVVDDGSFARAAAALAAAFVSGVVSWDLSWSLSSLSFLGDKEVKKARRSDWGRSFMVVICLLAYLLCLILRADNEGEMMMRV